MRVQIAPEPNPQPPAAPLPESRVLQGFVAAIHSDDSLFKVFELSAGSAASGTETGGHGFAGSFVLGFREDGLNQNRGLYLSLLEKLSELLRAAGSADSLEARLGLNSSVAGPNQVRLVLHLLATGASSEQAELRWGLGLVHVQQALLFTSRYLRQQLGARTG